MGEREQLKIIHARLKIVIGKKTVLFNFELIFRNVFLSIMKLGASYGGIPYHI